METAGEKDTTEKPMLRVPLVYCFLPSLVASLVTPWPTAARRARTPRLSIADDDSGGVDDSAGLWASLRERVAALDEETEERWRKAECTSSVCLALDDWIRRLALDQQGWPLAAIGSAQGNLYIADLSSGDIMASKLEAHPQRVSGGSSELDMRLLHGAYDGGGLLAVAFDGTRVVSAGRDGGARLWKYAKPNAEWPKRELAEIAVLDTGGASVSSILLTGGEAGAIWCACLDRHLHRFEVDEQGDVECTLTLRCASSCLALAACESQQLVVAATANGGVECFHMADGSTRGLWQPLAFDGSRGYKGASVRAVAIATVKGRQCVVVGGSDGSLHMRYLLSESEEEDGDCFGASQPGQALLPPHGGQCVTLTPLETGDGLLVSGAHDGSLRVWDLASEKTPQCLYGLGGYKVWLGSVCCDGRRLISDGRDNLVVLHDFSAEAAAEAEREEQQRDEQEEP